MYTTTVKELTAENFQPYGTFAFMLCSAKDDEQDKGAVRFYPDLVLGRLGDDTAASYSVCHCLKRPFVVDSCECHKNCDEVVLPLDGDVLLHVGRPTADGKPSPKDIEVFKVKKGTVVILRSGVWHHGPFALENDEVNVLIVLPEKTYAKDCYVFDLPEEEQVEIRF